jgi:tripartite-type tricarboxylate transporter receptor subunit TctC
MSPISRRTVLGGAAALAAQATTATAQIGARPIKLIVPWPPGGITDVTGRVLAQRLTQDLGQTVIVENRPGASGTVGHGVAAQAAPDGYTFLVATNSTYAMAPYLFEKLPYDNDKAFTPIGLVVRSPQFLCAHPSVPVKTFAEFLDYVRARQPDGVSCESSGPGSSSHLAAELLMALGKFRMLHVPYRGGGPALQALVAGEVNVGFVDAVVALPMAAGNQIKLLAVSTGDRVAMAPEIPTIAESGLAGFQSSTDISMFAPAGTPPEIIQRISKAMIAALKSPDVRDTLQKQGAIIVGGTPEEFPAYYKQETAKWSEIIRSRGIHM